MLSRKVAESEPLVKELAGYISSEVNRLNALVVLRFLDFCAAVETQTAPRKHFRRSWILPSKRRLQPARMPV